MSKKPYENGQRVAIFTRSGGEIARGKVRSGDNWPEANEHYTYVTFTYRGETRTEAWETSQVCPA